MARREAAARRKAVDKAKSISDGGDGADQGDARADAIRSRPRLYRTTFERRVGTVLALVAAFGGWLLADAFLADPQLADTLQRAAADGSGVAIWTVRAVYLAGMAVPFSAVYLLVGLFMWFTRVPKD